MKQKIAGLLSLIVLLVLVIAVTVPDIKGAQSIDFLPQFGGGVDDTITPSMFSSSLYYGMDTSVHPCEDFYQYVNGGWRRAVVLPASKNKETDFRYTDGVNTAIGNVYKQLHILIDSAVSVSNEIEDPNLRTVATFYQSCMVTDSLDTKLFARLQRFTPSTVDSSRRDQCFQRVIQHVGGVAGQLFVERLRNSSSAARMDIILSAIMKEAMGRITSNRILSVEQKKRASESLARLKLRVGIPEDAIDYSELILSETDYHKNIKDVKNYLHLRWATSIGNQPKDQWVYGLIRANANYIPSQHAIEIPPVWFFQPFFYEDGEDALNFAAVGWVIAHEIYHSIAMSIDMTDRVMAGDIDSFRTITSSLGTLDGWGTDGRKTLNEDLADMGGGRVAYAAWKATSRQKNSKLVKDSEGFTPDQRFFITMGRLWRAKWEGKVVVGSHAAPFARVNATMMQIPEFGKAFGCKPGDRMYLAPDRISKIW